MELPDALDHRLRELKALIAGYEEELARLETSLFNAEQKLRSLVPQTRTAQHAVGMLKGLVGQRFMLLEQISHAYDEFWDLYAPEEPEDATED